MGKDPESLIFSMAAVKVRPLSHGERVGVRGYGLSMDLNPSPGTLVAERADLSQRER
jgi:hypothetical protein